MQRQQEMNRPKGFYQRYSSNTSAISIGEGHDGRHISHSSPPLLQLAKEQKFDAIEELLTFSSPERINAYIDGSFGNAVDMGLQVFVGETILHLIMVYRPTVEVVDLLIKALSKKDKRVVPEAITDMQGRTPLTVAVINNCHVSVIRRLLDGVTKTIPALTTDSCKRLPLHWACTHESIVSKPNWSIRCTAKAKDSENMTSIIETLLRAYPNAAIVKDITGLTPWDIAVKKNADPYVQQILRIAWDSHQHKEDKSKACTDATETSEMPFEEFLGIMEDDFDDVSSMGSGGVSRVRNRHPKTKPIDVRKRYQRETTNI
jgi:Ankyrin repeats (3 copies)